MNMRRYLLFLPLFLSGCSSSPEVVVAPTPAAPRVVVAPKPASTPITIMSDEPAPPAMGRASDVRDTALLPSPKTGEIVALTLPTNGKFKSFSGGEKQYATYLLDVMPDVMATMDNLVKYVDNPLTEEFETAARDFHTIYGKFRSYKPIPPRYQKSYAVLSKGFGQINECLPRVEGKAKDSTAASWKPAVEGMAGGCAMVAYGFRLMAHETR